MYMLFLDTCTYTTDTNTDNNNWQMAKVHRTFGVLYHLKFNCGSTLMPNFFFTPRIYE
jgi:hypothetical protein